MDRDSTSSLAELVFYRRWAWRDTVRRYVIIVDGKHHGLLGHGRPLRVAVTPGQHTLAAKIDWTGSQTLPVSLNAGEQLRVRVSVAPGLLSPKLITNSPLLVLTADASSTGASATRL